VNEAMKLSNNGKGYVKFPCVKIVCVNSSDFCKNFSEKEEKIFEMHFYHFPFRSSQMLCCLQPVWFSETIKQQTETPGHNPRNLGWDVWPVYLLAFTKIIPIIQLSLHPFFCSTHAIISG